MGIRSALWEDGFQALKRYRVREGNCRVPLRHIDEAGFKLGNWVHTQRLHKDAMSVERRRRLDEIEFQWDAVSALWEDEFQALKRYREREGDCRVPQEYIDETGFKLGHWVSNQRYTKDKIPVERKRRLNEIGFIWRQK